MKPPLFPAEHLPRARNIRRMHVTDAGSNGWVKLECSHCGHAESGYYTETISELKRGLPCPCNNPGEA